MANKFNNRTLVIILVTLVGLFFVSRIIREKRSSGTLRRDLVKIDSSLVTSILLYPSAENGDEIIFTRTGNNWTVKKGDLSVDANNNNVQNMLSELTMLSPERLIARGQEKWSEYGVTDSLGTRVIMKQGEKNMVDLVVGRFDYQPSPSRYRGYGNNYGSGLTYVRLYNEPEVYVVQGFLAMSFNQTFNNWRNQTLLNINKNNITSLSFVYPFDSGFTAVKADTIWTINGIVADSASMAQYLGNISRKSNTSFIDNFTPVTSPDFQLTIEGMDMNPVTLKAFKTGEDNYVLNSSQNPGAYFSSSASGLFCDIFKSKSELIRKGNS